MRAIILRPDYRYEIKEIDQLPYKEIKRPPIQAISNVSEFIDSPVNLPIVEFIEIALSPRAVVLMEKSNEL